MFAIFSELSSAARAVRLVPVVLVVERVVRALFVVCGVTALRVAVRVLVALREEEIRFAMFTGSDDEVFVFKETLFRVGVLACATDVRDTTFGRDVFVAVRTFFVCGVAARFASEVTTRFVFELVVFVVVARLVAARATSESTAAIV